MERKRLSQDELVECALIAKIAGIYSTSKADHVWLVEEVFRFGPSWSKQYHSFDMQHNIENKKLTINIMMNAAWLIHAAEIEQKLIWGTSRDLHACAIQAVCLETGIFIKAMKIVDKTTFPVGFKLILEIELSPNHE